MITGLVLSNLLYPVVAVGVAIIIALIVVLWLRRPRSVEDNMKTFHRGMRALAPENSGQGQYEPAPIQVTPQPRAASNNDRNGAGEQTPDATKTNASRPEAEAG
jgi:hypothetical protein